MWACESYRWHATWGFMEKYERAVMVQTLWLCITERPRWIIPLCDGTLSLLSSRSVTYFPCFDSELTFWLALIFKQMRGRCFMVWFWNLGFKQSSSPCSWFSGQRLPQAEFQRLVSLRVNTIRSGSLDDIQRQQPDTWLRVILDHLAFTRSQGEFHHRNDHTWGRESHCWTLSRLLTHGIVN